VSEKIYILSPHIDDAAYGLTLSISKFINCNTDVTIINCFTITKWTIKFVSKETDVISALRKKEDAAYKKLFNDKLNIVNLDMIDAPLRKGYIFQFKPLEPAEWEVVDAIKKYLLENVDGILLCPLAVGDHIDHVICREAVIHLYNKLQVLFFEDLPYTQRVSAEQLNRHIEQLEEQLQVKLANNLNKVEEASINKEQAIRVYETQLNDEICSEIMAHMNSLQGERLWGEEKVFERLNKLKLED
jgi:LmbE family N-acetylglucosaminyl deacetylase